MSKIIQTCMCLSYQSNTCRGITVKELFIFSQKKLKELMPSFLTASIVMFHALHPEGPKDILFS